MFRLRQMIETHPAQAPVDAGTLAEAIDACFECAQTCTARDDACLGEDNPAELAYCISTDLDRAGLCDTAGRVISRQTAVEPETIRAAAGVRARACEICGDECEKHANHHEHCRMCSEARRRCEQACNEVLSVCNPLLKPEDAESGEGLSFTRHVPDFHGLAMAWLLQGNKVKRLTAVSNVFGARNE